VIVEAVTKYDRREEDELVLHEEARVQPPPDLQVRVNCLDRCGFALKLSMFFHAHVIV
jgi:hypothetical protein